MHHLAELAERCSDLPTSFYKFQVVELWVFGDLLDVPRDVETIEVALVTDLPVDEVPWLSEPVGAEHWANATRLSRNPFAAHWRSKDAPVWNHRIERPTLIWSAAGGIDEEALVAVSDGTAELVRQAAPSPEELRRRIADELAVSLAALRAANQAYTDRRWSPGKLTPHSDALWRATTGYLDLLDASG
ncbi:hypothetical protein SAMN05216188_10355 [Lentzea xinjiangensis]|uniref:DUF7711 domain-containing protein n=1 Tax=Lentzea xinjiangensis TaxID=402600 RepID=A0A1H9G2A4_9PSEU|nr:hypothetical protein [Lentzea xinjiangensis]SEQ44285.1 hypothetical protein SAMN05216188_10355 [Lentzea xinjiangensis]